MRNKITGAIGLALGVFLFLPVFMSPELMADPNNIPWIAVLMIILGVYYLFFKKPPLEDTVDIIPEDRLKNSESEPENE